MELRWGYVLVQKGVEGFVEGGRLSLWMNYGHTPVFFADADFLNIRLKSFL